MIRRWDVDDKTVVVATTGAFGRNSLTVNGKPVGAAFSLRKKNEAPFALGPGRPASLSITPRFGSVPAIDLWVGGRLMVETAKQPLKCSACAAVVKPNDRFCAKCGHAMPPPEDYAHRKNLKEAARMIWILGALFAVFGAIVFVAQKSQAEAPLAKLAHMNPADTVPNDSGGPAPTVAELRAQLQWAPWGALIVNLVLAAIMAVLALWARKAPLAALLVATATYAVLIVTNAVLDPRTIAQGIFFKIVVIALLFRGIKAALALRKADA